MRPTGPTLARLDRPTGPTTRFAVISDPHLTDRAEGTWKVYHRTAERFMAAIGDANRAELDGVVIAGDLTKDGHPAEFQLARDLLATLDVPYIAVPGNHDVPKAEDAHTTPPVDSFERRFGPGPYPATRRLGAVDIVAINTATGPDGELFDEHGGTMTEADLDALEHQLSMATNPIVVGHHNVFRSSEQAGPVEIEALHDPISNRTGLQSVLQAHDVPLLFTGHNHWPGVARENGVTEVASPATASLPQSYLLVSIDPSGTTIELVPLADKLALEEAYQYATNGSARSTAIAAAFDTGYVDSFPVVDDTSVSRRRVSRVAALERLLP